MLQIDIIIQVRGRLMVDVLGSLALFPKVDGFLRREVYHDKSIGASLSRIPNGLFFSIGDHGIVVTCRSQD